MRGNRVSYFNFFNLFSGGCCKSVKAEFTGIGWYKLQLRSFKLQLGRVNEKAHYISSDGKNGIWYSHGKWLVGPQKNKGTRTAYFELKSYADCPTEPHDQWNWRYISTNSRGFKIVCKD